MQSADVIQHKQHLAVTFTLYYNFNAKWV